MWPIWITIAGFALAGAYALAPTRHVMSGSPDAPLAVADDMALYRTLLVQYVAGNHAASGTVPSAAFVPDGNWNYAPKRWQNYVTNGIVVVYPASGGPILPAGFAAALVDASQGSVEAGVVQNGIVVNPLNPGPGVLLPSGLPSSISDGTPVWIAQAF